MSRAKYTKEDFYNEIKRLHNEFGMVDRYIFKEHTKINIDYVYYCHKFGGIKNILKDLNLEWRTHNQIKREDLIADITRVYNEFGTFSKSIYEAHGKYASIAVMREFANWNNVRKFLNIDIYERNVTKEDVLKDITIFVAKYNSTSSSLYRAHGKYSITITDKFGGWVRLLKELGLNPMNEKLGRDFIISEVEKVYKEFGFISKNLINDNCTFTYQAFKSYFKNMSSINDYFGTNVFLNNRKSTNAKIIETYLIDKYGEENVLSEHTWDWLINEETGFHMYADYFIPSENLVIEYDGEQHFQYIEYFHKNHETYLKQQQRDKLKDKLVEQHSDYKLIRFNCKEKLSSIYIENKLDGCI